MYSAIFQISRQFRTCACLGSTVKFFQTNFIFTVFQIILLLSFVSFPLLFTFSIHPSSPIPDEVSKVWEHVSFCRGSENNTANKRASTILQMVCPIKNIRNTFLQFKKKGTITQLHRYVVKSWKVNFRVHSVENQMDESGYAAYFWGGGGGG